MAKYQIYNGTEWVDICNCNLNVLNHNNIWKKIDPKNCQVRFWTGEKWCLVECGGPLVCGGELDVSFNGRGVFYVPFTITTGIKTINVYLSPAGNPDGFSIVTSDRTTKLASIGFAGKNGVLGWDVNNIPNPIDVYIYDGNNFVPDGTTMSQDFYGEGVGDPPGDTPMSNTNGNSMYVPENTGTTGPIIPNPPTTSSSPFCSTDPQYVDTCYVMSYTRADDTIDEDVLIQVIGGNTPNTGWTISYVECLEDESQCQSIIDSFFAKIQNEEITDEDRFTSLEFILVNGIDGSNVNNCCPSCGGEGLQNTYYFGSIATFVIVAEALATEIDVCCLDDVVLT